MTLPFDQEVAPASAMMAPSAVQSRRQSRPRGAGAPTPAMLAYRDALRVLQPASDHQVSQHLRRELGITDPDDSRWSLTTINGRRNDWHVLDPDCIAASGRVQVRGHWRTLWTIKAGSRADLAVRS